MHKLIHLIATASSRLVTLCRAWAGPARRIVERCVHVIDLVNEYIGRAMGWLMTALVALVTFDVISRYLFSTGWVVVQETEWWMYSVVFLMGAGYTYLYDGHVRVDIIYSRLSTRWKRIVDLIGVFIFLFPMSFMLILSSRGYVLSSWQMGEGSPDPGGLPAYYVLKAVIPLGFFFLTLQGLSNLYKISRLILWPEEDETSGIDARVRAAGISPQAQAGTPEQHR